MSDQYNIIDLSNDGEGRVTVALGNTIVILITKYNYSAKCWTLDIYDSQEVLILSGIMLVPNIDLLKPYTEVKRTLGSLVLVEKSVGEYVKVDSLGATTALLWFPTGEEIVLPE